MKKFVLILAVALLAGCSDSVSEWRPDAPLPEGLRDCDFYDVWDTGSLIRIVRCPNSSTTANYTQGKSNASTTTID